MLRATNNQRNKNYKNKKMQYLPIRVEEKKVISNVQAGKKTVRLWWWEYKF